MKLFDSNLPWILLTCALAVDLLVQNLMPALWVGYNLRLSPPSELVGPKCPQKAYYCGWIGIFSVIMGLEALNSLDAFLPLSVGWAIVLALSLLFYAVFWAMAAFAPRDGEKKRGGKPKSSEFYKTTAAIAPHLLIPAVLALGVLLLLDGRTALGVTALCCLVPQIACTVLFILSGRPRFYETPIMQPGLWSRLTTLFGYIPMLALGVSLL